MAQPTQTLSPSEDQKHIPSAVIYPRFSVICMTNDNTQIRQNFVRYYKALGADQILMYFDGKTDEDLAIEGCDVTLCDAAFWEGLGISRPGYVEERQRQVYAHAYRRLSVDWVLIVDSDEFLYTRKETGEILASVDSHINAVRFRPVEGIYTDIGQAMATCSSTYFRTVQHKYMAPFVHRLFYGRVAGYFSRGLTGHSIGKIFLRTGLANVDINIHHATFPGDQPIGEVEVTRFDTDACLVHFVVLSYPHWLKKWSDRFESGVAKEMGKKNDSFCRMFGKTNNEAGRQRLFGQMFIVNPRRLNLMQAMGIIRKIDIDR